MDLGAHFRDQNDVAEGFDMFGVYIEQKQAFRQGGQENGARTVNLSRAVMPRLESGSWYLLQWRNLEVNAIR